MSGRSFTMEEVDSSSRLLLEQTVVTRQCRSGECIHNQAADASHFFWRCCTSVFVFISCTYAPGEWSVADQLWMRKTQAWFYVWSNPRGSFTEHGLMELNLQQKCTAFTQAWSNMHLYWLNESFMLYLCTIYGGCGFPVQGPTVVNFSVLTMTWSPIKVCNF